MAWMVVGELNPSLFDPGHRTRKTIKYTLAFIALEGPTGETTQLKLVGAFGRDPEQRLPCDGQCQAIDRQQPVVPATTGDHQLVRDLPGHVGERLDQLGSHDGGVVAVVLQLDHAQADHPVEASPTRGPRGQFTPIVRDDVLVSAEWIEERLYGPGIALIDSRPEGEYTGRIPTRIGGRAGHIPGARNLYWEDLLVSSENPVLRDFTDVQLQFLGAGADYGAIVVNYCYVGMRASYTYLIAKHLGYDARLYDGSWNEWSKNDSLPAVTGS